MAGLSIEWDGTKSRSNKRKHGVSFEEAATVFGDENALLRADPDHSAEEERFLLLGLSAAIRILVVVHCYPEAAGTIRIISARKATKSERAQYQRRLRR